MIDRLFTWFVLLCALFVGLTAVWGLIDFLMNKLGIQP